MSNYVKVSMNLTQRDVKNTDKVKNYYHLRTKADAVSTALSVTSMLADAMKHGKEVIIRDRGGNLEKLWITSIDNE